MKHEPIEVKLDLVLASVRRWREHPQEVWGLPTGLASFDALTGGLHPGELSILAGRPGMGKSALGCQIAWYLADHMEDLALDGRFVAIISAEMSAEQVLLREVARRVRIPANQIRKGAISEQDEERIAQVVQRMRVLPVYLDDTYGIGVGDMLLHLDRASDELGEPAFILIDHVGRLSIGDQVNRYWAYSNISNQIARLPRRYRCPVMVISQLNREVERRDDHIPQISDLRETGVLEQDADNVYLLYREDYYRVVSGSALPDEEGEALIIVGKAREGGVGVVRVTYNPVFTEFLDPEP